MSAVNAVSAVIRGTPCNRRPGGRSSACFQSPSWPRLQTVPSVPTATTTPGNGAGEALRSAPAPRWGAPGSGSAALSLRMSALWRTTPAGSIDHTSLPTVTEPVGGNAVLTAGTKLFPAFDDTSVAPAPVRTVIVSPMAATRVMGAPPRPTRLHHGAAARAGVVPMIIPVSAVVASNDAMTPRRRASEAIQPRDDAELEGDVGDRMDDHRGPQRIGALHEPAEGESHEEGDRDERRLRTAIGDREVGKAEHRRLADVRPARTHGPLERAEEDASELHLLSEGLQRIRRSKPRKVPADRDRLQRHPAEQPCR